MLQIAIIGRPNVGKSTLFNRLVRADRKPYTKALVHDTPGLTRDRRMGIAELDGLEVNLVDTAGLEQAKKDTLEADMMTQTLSAIDTADVVLFMVDAKSGLHPHDSHFAKILHKKGAKTILVANKCDAKIADDHLEEFKRLGFGTPCPISAAHQQGLLPLANMICEKMSIVKPKKSVAEEEDGFEDETIVEEERPVEPIRITIIGRPNVGKSTLLNHIIGEERVITSDVPGTTRDAISTMFSYKGRALELIDTAGIRKHSKERDELEGLAINNSYDAINFAHVTIMVMDANIALEKNDLSIISHVLEEGRALVLALNKWDLVENPNTTLKHLRERLEDKLPQAEGVVMQITSALYERNIEKLLQAACEAYDTWNKRISTSKLNAWLEGALARHSPPLSKSGRRITFRYITQTGTRPPTFTIFTSSDVTELPESYMRYLIAGIRETFSFFGVPIRLYVRKNKNPYRDVESSASKPAKKKVPRKSDKRR